MTYSKKRKYHKSRGWGSGLGKRYPRGRVMQELKFKDVATSVTAITAPTVVYVIFPVIPVGADEDERLGRAIIMRKMFSRFIIKRTDENDASLASDIVRIMVVMDKQSNGTLASGLNPTKILSTSDLTSFNNLGNRYRFRTMYDKVFTMNAQCAYGDGTTNETGLLYKYGKISLPYLNCPIEYNSVGAGIEAEVNSCTFWLLVFSEVAQGTTVTLNTRWRWSDGLT